MKWAVSNEEDIEKESPGVILQTILTVLEKQPFGLIEELAKRTQIPQFTFQ
jgi:hypothetical protein